MPKVPFGGFRGEAIGVTITIGIGVKSEADGFSRDYSFSSFRIL
jgi:hypothetical protein